MKISQHSDYLSLTKAVGLTFMEETENSPRRCLFFLLLPILLRGRLEDGAGASARAAFTALPADEISFPLPFDSFFAPCDVDAGNLKEERCERRSCPDSSCMKNDLKQLLSMIFIFFSFSKI